MFVFRSVSRTTGQTATIVNVPKAGMALTVRLQRRLARISPARMGQLAVTPLRATPVSVPRGSVALAVSIR
jgi:hypothetical protein